MTPLEWSALLSWTGVLSYLGAGRRRRDLRIGAGVLGVISEPLWLVYGWQSGGYWFALNAVTWTAAAVANTWTAWWEGRDRTPHPPAYRERAEAG